MKDLITVGVAAGLIATTLMSGEPTIEELEGLLETEALIAIGAYLLLLHKSYKWTERAAAANKRKAMEKELDEKLDNIFTQYSRKQKGLIEKLIERAADSAIVNSYQKLKGKMKLKRMEANIKKSMINEIKTGFSLDGMSLQDRLIIQDVYLSKKIKGAVIRGIRDGRNVDQIMKTVGEQIDVKKGSLKRAIRDELSRIHNDAVAAIYKNNDIKNVRFDAVIDSKTTDKCRSLDGKIYELSELKAGKNMPPLHYNCRSTLVPLM